MDTYLRRAERALAQNPDDTEAREAVRTARRRAGALTFTVEYSSNNSGGSWWLSADDWAALVRTGWVLDGRTSFDNQPTAASKVVTAASADDALDVARQDWQAATGQSPDTSGCECCGRPHNFYASAVE